MTAGLPQTNIQLYDQLVDAGRTEHELATIRAAYEHALVLFSGQVHPSGKPLVAHLVGTAGIVAGAGLPADAVAAALLHAAYIHGDFGDGVGGWSARNRSEVAGVIGPEAEALVFLYPNTAWGETAIRDLAAGRASLSERKRLVVLIRVANEIDDHLDHGIRYCEDFELRPFYDADGKQLVAQIAERLDCGSLADLWRRSLAANTAIERPAVLRREQAPRSVWPRSYRIRLLARLRQLRRGLRG